MTGAATSTPHNATIPPEEIVESLQKSWAVTIVRSYNSCYRATLLKQVDFKKVIMPPTFVYGAMSVTTLIGLVTLTFDLLTSK